jgi:hypothetical protein
MNKFIFIIDTDSYAGNFEREMCAYITGVTGDCKVGDEFSDIYLKETKEKESSFLELLEQRPDEHGCCRPCSIWLTKEWLYDGKDGEVKEEEFNAEIANENYRKHTASYYQEQYQRTKEINIDDENNKRSGWNKESLKKELARLQKEIDRCLSKKTVCPITPPNNSVAIFFYKKPTEKMLNLMKKRANNFAEIKRNIGNEWDKNFKLTIHGFRLIEEKLTSNEIKI